MGSEILENAAYVLDVWLQLGQVTLDFSWPYNNSCTLL